jgi:hypothetical protein
MYTVTYREMERAALALFSANLDKTCQSTTCLKHLIARPLVITFVASQNFLNRRLPIDQAQCDHQAGWRNFSLNTLEKEPNICSNHVTGKHCLPSPLHITDMLYWSCRHCRRLHSAHTIFRLCGPPRQVRRFLHTVGPCQGYCNATLRQQRAATLGKVHTRGPWAAAGR